MAAEKSESNVPSFSRPSKGELTATMELDAPRELVFRAWTEAEQLSQWFGPRSIEMPFCEVDARPGGMIHFCHRFADGTELWVKGTYLAVKAPEHLAFRVAFVDRADKPAPHPMFPEWPLAAAFETYVTLLESGRGTRLELRQIVTPPSAAQSSVVAGERGLAQEGWKESLERLAERLVEMGAR
jgi:uncharacterized protein YndB with AHSA1/START domain